MNQSQPTHFYDAYVFDLDGTIYSGSTLLPGAKSLIDALQAHGKPVRFLSNNPTRTVETYAEKLTALGIDTTPMNIVNSVSAMTRWLRDHHPRAVVFPIAENALIEDLHEAGIATSDDPEHIDIVIASYDRTFNYQKLQIAFDAIWFHRHAILVATNPDPFCPFPGGRGEPDTAAIIAAIEASTGAKLAKNVGKPDPGMLTTALSGLDVDPLNCIMVGDRLDTDIQMATRIGMPSALVLTGASSRADSDNLPDREQPTCVLERIDQLLPGPEASVAP